MIRDDAALATWDERLRRAEADLLAREEHALANEPTPQQLAAFAAERDRLAADRDTMAGAYDDLATAHASRGLDRDLTASGRDRHARALDQDRDAAYLDRFAAGVDRDWAASDRADSLDDLGRAQDARRRAAADRERAADDRDQATQLAGDQDRELAGLRRALESRLIIGQAVGLLMARHAVRRDDGFDVLVRLSKHHNVKLRDVARQLVDAAEDELTGGDDRRR